MEPEEVLERATAETGILQQSLTVGPGSCSQACKHPGVRHEGRQNCSGSHRVVCVLRAEAAAAFLPASCVGMSPASGCQVAAARLQR